jgi:two-component system, sensor histidine kinase and response regulator
LQGDRDRCIAAGMDEYLTKPIRSEALFQMVERFATGDGLVTVRQDGVEVMAPASPPPPDARASTARCADWRHALEVTGGDRNLLREITEAFCEEAPQLAGKLADCRAARDLPQLKRTAHTLKTAFGTFGFEAARKAAQAIEIECQNGQSAIPADRIDELVGLTRQLCEECRRHLNSNGAPGTIDAAQS